MSDDKSGQCAHGYYGLCPHCYDSLRAELAELRARVPAICFPRQPNGEGGWVIDANYVAAIHKDCFPIEWQPCEEEVEAVLLAVERAAPVTPAAVPDGWILVRDCGTHGGGSSVQNGYVTVDVSILNTEWLAAACREAGIVRNIGATPETIIGAAIHGYLLAASKGEKP